MHRTTQPRVRPSRRRFVQAAAGLGLSVAGLSLAAGCSQQVAPYFSASPGDKLETTRIRLSRGGGICSAPQIIATELLQAEGFADVQYIPTAEANPYPGLASGDIDFSIAFSAQFIVNLDRGAPIVMLGGVHVGCFEVFGADNVHAIRDLRGKTVGVPAIDGAHQLFLSSMAAYVGLDPRVDINWFLHSPTASDQILTGGQVDALIAFPPITQDLRSKKIGHVVASSAEDKPWSQYFCCTLIANRQFAQSNPVATKRTLRAILKATELCAQEPERVARMISDGGFSPNYGYALQTMREIPYDRWREYDPEDTVRFYALRLREIGMIKMGPDEVIRQGTNWQFFNQLKQELKA